MPELCLVTGGAGFIGSHVVDGLLAAGKRVRVFDDLSTGQGSNLPAGAEFVRGCVTDVKALTAAAADCSVVYHLAAMASVAKSLEDPLACHAVCATGTLNALVAAKAAGARRVVYAASSSCYGPAADPAGLSEDTPLRPLSPYAAAKLAGEHYLESFAESFGIETVRLRFFNIFGPRQRADSPYSGVIALFIAAMARGETPTVHGDGLQSRDFTFVANAVQALRKAADADASVASGNVYNVGTGRSVTVLDLVNALNVILGKSLSVTHAPSRAGDVRFSLADVSRTRRDLGYDPQVSFEDGLRQTVQWYLDQKTDKVPVNSVSGKKAVKVG
jgi:UDP-glucose 4-epimerase